MQAMFDDVGSFIPLLLALLPMGTSSKYCVSTAIILKHVLHVWLHAGNIWAELTSSKEHPSKVCTQGWWADTSETQLGSSAATPELFTISIRRASKVCNHFNKLFFSLGEGCGLFGLSVASYRKDTISYMSQGYDCKLSVCNFSVSSYIMAILEYNVTITTLL